MERCKFPAGFPTADVPIVLGNVAHQENVGKILQVGRST